MRYISLLLMSCLLVGCSARQDDVPFVEPPAPVITQDVFVQLFRDLCLSGLKPLSDFQREADRLGLRQTRAENRFGDTVFEWAAPQERGMSPLLLRVGRGNIVYEIANDGSGSGLPTRIRSCTVSAHLPGSEDSGRADLGSLVANQLSEESNAIDYGPYAGAQSVSAEDAQVVLDLPKLVFKTQITPGSGNERQEFSIQTPTTLTHEVVLSRIP